MKRLFIIILAAALAAALFTGCMGKQSRPSGSGLDPGAKTTAQPDNTPHAADPQDYDNSVMVTDGRVDGSAFNWLFFKGKSGAGRAAEIQIVSVVNGESRQLVLNGGSEGFKLTGDMGEASYAYLLTFTADFPEDSEVSSAEISVLTNDPDISAEDFFGGAVPTDVRIGDTTELGMVIFTDYR